MLITSHCRILFSYIVLRYAHTVSNLVSRELEAESIVVFDEAHNIDNVCIEALSVTLDRRTLEHSSRSIAKLQSKVAELKASDSAKLAKEYAELVSGLAQQRHGTNLPSAGGGGASSSSSGTGGGGAGAVQAAADSILANPVLSADILEEAVPGTVGFFTVFLCSIVGSVR